MNVSALMSTAIRRGVFATSAVSTSGSSMQVMSASPDRTTTEHIPSPAGNAATEISKPDARQLLTALCRAVHALIRQQVQSAYRMTGPASAARQTTTGDPSQARFAAKSPLEAHDGAAIAVWQRADPPGAAR
jgi:hypothetical protein